MSEGPMRVLLVVPWDQEFGGVVSVAGLLATFLQGRGHDVLFLHPDDSVMSPQEGRTSWGFRGIKLALGLPFGSRYGLLNLVSACALVPYRLYQIVRLIRRHRIQIVNIHYPMPSFVYFALCRWLLPIRLVMSIHGADVVKSRRVTVKYALAMRALLFSADLIVANSRAFQEEFLHRFPRLRRKTTCIYNGVNLVEMASPARDVAAQHGRYILCIAVQAAHKGVDVLIRALARLDGITPPIRLLLVGDGPRRDQFEDLARSLGVAERVVFLGWKSRREVVTLLHGCEIFVLPSRSEPLGIVIIEALACRKAVVASATGGIPEVIVSGKNGLLVEPDNPDALADAIRTVFTNPDLRSVLCANGYSTVSNGFRHDLTGAAYETALEGMLT
jgi:glycosyltransferase involved in cell wall biosynthesis